MQIKQMDYEDYVNLQKEKTEDPIRRNKWLSARHENAVKFTETFKVSSISCHLPNDKMAKILCVGARTGEEVLALRMLGYENTIGIDLVPCDQLVIYGDMHDMPFEDGEFEFVYTNVIDHSLHPKKFVSETFRVLSGTGVAFFQLQVGTAGDKYGVNEVQSVEDFVQMVANVAHEDGVKINQVLASGVSVLTPHNHGLNCNLIINLGLQTIDK
jgi:SAM-dependent methyltransferase